MLVLFIVLFFTEMYRKKGLAMLASSNKTPWMLWLSWLKGGGVEKGGVVGHLTGVLRANKSPLEKRESSAHR